MTTPTWLLASALVLWGGFAGGLPMGIGLGLLILAGPALVRRELTPRVFSRIVDASVAASAVVLAYFVAARGFPSALHEWLRLAPLWLFPLPFAQHLDGGKVPISALLLSKRLRPDPSDTRRFDTTTAYVLVCLLAATAIAEPNPWLYPAMGMSMGIVLWRLPASGRDKRWRLLLLLIAFVAGYAVHSGLYRLQGKVEDWSTGFFTAWLRGEPDPFRSQTHIGDLGRIKLGNRIVMRVGTNGSQDALLLREAVYDTYLNGGWYARGGRFAPLTRQGDGFQLQAASRTRRIALAISLPGGHGLLPLPAGTTRLTGVIAGETEGHPLGAVRVRDAATWQSFAADFDDALNRSAPPDPRDLQVPDTLRPALATVLDGIGSDGEPPARRLAAVKRFFAERFRYSLFLGKQTSRSLAEFLLRDRRGHCEYFATATVLLLRQAGIPARYAVGYSAQEYSPREHGFVVRERHAHAWAMAFVDGRWRDVDTTPAEWAEAESDAAMDWYQPVLDLLSWANFSLRESRLPGVPILAGVALLAVLFRFRRRFVELLRRRRMRPRPTVPDPAEQAWRRVEAAFPDCPRAPNETPQAWLARLTAPEPAALRQLLADYYRLRFDPRARDESHAAFVARCDAFVQRRRDAQDDGAGPSA